MKQFRQAMPLPTMEEPTVSKPLTVATRCVATRLVGPPSLYAPRDHLYTRMTLTESFGLVTSGLWLTD